MQRRKVQTEEIIQHTQNIKLDAAIMFFGLVRNQMPEYGPMLSRVFGVKPRHIIDRSLWLQTQPEDYTQLVAEYMVGQMLSCNLADFYAGVKK